MNMLFVVGRLRDWTIAVPGVTVVPARAYLTDARYARAPDCKVFNLCECRAYQDSGYYVSMLAEARGHAPLPDIKALEDLGSDHLLPLLAERFDELMQSALAHVQRDAFELDVYFGRSADARLALLSAQLFDFLRLPLLRLVFERSAGRRASDRRWRLHAVRMLDAAQLGPAERQSAARAAADCVQGHRNLMEGSSRREPAASKPALAILRSPDCTATPSNPAAIRRFQEAAEALGMRSEIVTHADAPRLLQPDSGFDALFIRDTTNVNHYTYRIARQAALGGMVVMDDPDSILKCNNKVFMTELLERHALPMPRTMKVHRDNLDQVTAALGLPCILKQPDGAFSAGVEKVASEDELQRVAQRLFASSELLLAQEYLPTEFDWRIGILDRKPLFACRYFMAPGHWQIIKHEDNRPSAEGRAEAVKLSAVPPQVIDVALRAANLIGDGFYGVDLKQRGRRCYVIEINDNPNVDAGNEDGVLQEALYLAVMGVIRRRIQARKGSIA